PIALTECSISHQGCEQAAGCEIGANWSLSNQTVFNALEAITLKDMLRPVATPQEITIPVSSLYR
ncbi:MAG: SUF system Fe-S cluster assembly regulator, partial [Methylococcaceae bacterium]|nr:SUF system Fe-S cluster assembly regulator [Methylococcaceae bacterium]